MSIYISLLRGINVSGQKKVNMKELKALYESLGLKQVTTYIQSGNVVFYCNDKSPKELKVLLRISLIDFYLKLYFRVVWKVKQRWRDHCSVAKLIRKDTYNINHTDFIGNAFSSFTLFIMGVYCLIDLLPFP